MAQIGKDIDQAKRLLQAGELVAIPTETVYGLAGNAFNHKAVASIFETKNRPSFDPLIVHTFSLREIEGLVKSIPASALLLAERFWPGPLTLLLPRKKIIPDLVTAGLDTVAVRIPNQPLTLELLQHLGFPLVAPSANPFGYVSPTAANHVNDQLGDKIPYILDGGNCHIGIESTIIGFENDEVIIHRLGGTSKEKIESIVGKVKVQAYSSSNPKAPGMLKSHYSPGKMVCLGSFEELSNMDKNKNTAAITLSKPLEGVDADNNIILTEDNDLASAAQHLFSALRALDRPDIDTILAEIFPEHGLGRAMNDRLRRAAATSS